MKNIARFKTEFDAVAIIRGGGAKLDLMAFDNYHLAKAVAKFPLPVFTGIGHEIDETIVDLAAHTSLKTPTAVASFIINHNVRFESELMELGQSIKAYSLENIQAQNFYLKEMQQAIQFHAQQCVSESNRMLEYIQQEVPRYSKYILRSAGERLNFLSEMSQLLNPEATLKRGYSITTKNGKIIKDATQLKSSEEIETQLAKGTLKSTIKSTHKHEQKGK